MEPSIIFPLPLTDHQLYLLLYLFFTDCAGQINIDLSYQTNHLMFKNGHPWCAPTPSVSTYRASVGAKNAPPHIKSQISQTSESSIDSWYYQEFINLINSWVGFCCYIVDALLAAWCLAPSGFCVWAVTPGAQLWSPRQDPEVAWSLLSWNL